MRPVAVLCIAAMLAGLFVPGIASAEKKCSDPWIIDMTISGTMTEDQIRAECGMNQQPGPALPPEVRRRLAEAQFRTSVAAAAGNEQVAVSWKPVDGATGYTVYYSTRPDVNPATATAVPAGTGTSVVVTALSGGTMYYFVVTATYATGPGPSSISVSATPIAALAAPSRPLAAEAPPEEQKSSSKWWWIAGSVVVLGALAAGGSKGGGGGSSSSKPSGCTANCGSASWSW